ncbi:MAG: hypothetical protein Q8941_07145 [Bacteroidota bacterium]|nr:hypothetical protein [Bacteroidota bacterium]
MPVKILLCFLLAGVISGCFNREKKKLSVPVHSYYIPQKIQWQETEFDPGYLKKVSKEDIDSMIILTKRKIIIIKGQFGLTVADSILMPWTGKFGITYEVLNNEGAELSDNTIHFGKTIFIKWGKVNFQWWNEILGKIGSTGKGTIIVSGP